MINGYKNRTKVRVFICKSGLLWYNQACETLELTMDLTITKVLMKLKAYNLVYKIMDRRRR